MFNCLGYYNKIYELPTYRRCLLGNSRLKTLQSLHGVGHSADLHATLSTDNPIKNPYAVDNYKWTHGA